MAIGAIGGYSAGAVAATSMPSTLANTRQLTEARTGELVKGAVAATSGQAETGNNPGSVEAISRAVKAAAAEEVAKSAYGSTGTFSKPAVGANINTSA